MSIHNNSDGVYMGLLNVKLDYSMFGFHKPLSLYCISNAIVAGDDYDDDDDKSGDRR